VRGSIIFRVARAWLAPLAEAVQQRGVSVATANLSAALSTGGNVFAPSGSDVLASSANTRIAVAPV